MNFNPKIADYIVNICLFLILNIMYKILSILIKIQLSFLVLNPLINIYIHIHLKRQYGFQLF